MLLVSQDFFLVLFGAKFLVLTLHMTNMCFLTSFWNCSISRLLQILKAVLSFIILTTCYFTKEYLEAKAKNIAISTPKTIQIGKEVDVIIILLGPE